MSKESSNKESSSNEEFMKSLKEWMKEYILEEDELELDYQRKYNSIYDSDTDDEH
jgi:hypothetical protein